MGRDDDESSWGRQLLLGAAVLAVVSVVVGAVIGLLALGAANVVGIGPGDNPSQSPSLYMPSGVPTTQPDVYPPAKQAATPSSPVQPQPSATTEPDKPKKPAAQISLQGFPNQVSRGQRIDLTGVYQGGEGAVLQVQRFENGSWTDFPVTTSVSGGIFSTYVTTSRAGQMRFRVVDKASGRHSNPVQVAVS